MGRSRKRTCSCRRSVLRDNTISRHGKSYTVFLSPATKQTYNSNAGGYFGPFLKFSGFDALEIQGKADRPVVVFIDGDNFKVQVFESTIEENNAYYISEELHDYFAKDEQDKRTISVISTGMAARTSYIVGLNFSFYDVRRKAVRLKQAGRGGGGTVLCDKNVTAIVVKRTKFTGIENDPVDVETIMKAGVSLHKRIHDHDNEQLQDPVPPSTQHTLPRSWTTMNCSQ